MNGRLMIRSAVAIALLYVLVSMAAAFARFPGHEIDAKGGYRHNTAVTVAEPEEMGELRAEHFLP